MPILNAQFSSTGLAGVFPAILYLDTNDTVAQVTAAGYLNGLVKENMPISTKVIACVTTKTTPNATTSTVGWYGIQDTAGVWSLLTVDPLTLPNGDIFVGNVSGVATAVPMSGDVHIVASGATTIQPNAITTAKILAGNVTLGTLSTGITPSHVVKFGAKYTTVGGAAAEAITVTGALATDIAFVQLVAPGTNTVTVHFAVMTSNTLTVTFSADPGNNAIINYQILRAAA